MSDHRLLSVTVARLLSWWDEHIWHPIYLGPLGRIYPIGYYGHALCSAIVAYDMKHRPWQWAPVIEPKRVFTVGNTTCMEFETDARGWQLLLRLRGSVVTDRSPRGHSSSRSELPSGVIAGLQQWARDCPDQYIVAVVSPSGGGRAYSVNAISAELWDEEAAEHALGGIIVSLAKTGLKYAREDAHAE
jgi:hypothetical protein